MRASELRKNSLIQLKAICKDNKIKYRGYSKYKKKEDLVKFILKTNSIATKPSYIKIPPPTDLDMGLELYTMFETEDETEDDNDMYQEMMLVERPEGRQIDELIVSLKDKYPSSNIIYDTHNDTQGNIIYNANKGKYIRHFNSLGEHGEKILYHGTDGCNLMGILRDDFRLTSMPIHGSLFGKGIYFTNDIEKAIYYSERNGGQTKYIIVAIVHIGDIVRGSSTMDIHPLMPCGLKHYDTSVDNIQNPKQFVKKKNGTYNILGIITIENYIEPSRNKFSGSLKIRNTTGGPIKISWVPPAHINELPFVNPTHLKQMSIIRGRYTKNDILCQIGHTFICTNKYGIIRIFKSKYKKEVIAI
tara:strand:- start:267 stop:1343 length:1077 start_codon:yes stop_codon:yes gene_type:complete